MKRGKVETGKRSLSWQWWSELIGGAGGVPSSPSGMREGCGFRMLLCKRVTCVRYVRRVRFRSSRPSFFSLSRVRGGGQNNVAYQRFTNEDIFQHAACAVVAGRPVHHAYIRSRLLRVVYLWHYIWYTALHTLYFQQMRPSYFSHTTRPRSRNHGFVHVHVNFRL